MYHQLNNPSPASSLVISPESFSRQIDWLEEKKFRFLSLDEVVERQAKIPLGERSVCLTFDDGFRDNKKGFQLLIERRKTAALFVVVQWVGRENFLDWKEIKELADAGITIGSHALSHRWLPDISNEEELKKEIFDSKKKIEDEIGRKVHHFCYPVGGTDERVAGLVKKAGYQAAWVAGARPSIQIQDPLFCLRRIKVGPKDHSLVRFAMKAYGLKTLFRA